MRRFPLRRMLAGGGACVLGEALRFGHHHLQSSDPSQRRLIAVDRCAPIACRSRSCRASRPSERECVSTMPPFRCREPFRPGLAPRPAAILTTTHPHMFRGGKRARSSLPPSRVCSPGALSTAVITDFARYLPAQADLGFGRVVAPTFSLREVVRERCGSDKPPLALLGATSVGGPCPCYAIHTRRTRLCSRARRSTRSIGKRAPVLLDALLFDAALSLFGSRAVLPPFADPSYRAGSLQQEHRSWTRSSSGRGRHSPIRALFDGAVLATDHALGQLLDASERASAATHRVVTARPRECLYDGRGPGHRTTCRSDAVGVRWWYDPPRTIRRVSQAVARGSGATLCESRDSLSGGDGVDRSGPSARSPCRPACSRRRAMVHRADPECGALRFPYPDLLCHDSCASTEPRSRFVPSSSRSHRSEAPMVRDERYKLLYMRAGAAWSTSLRHLDRSGERTT